MNQQDLTRFFLQAQALENTWSPQRVIGIASLILRNCGGKLDWDTGAGEDWATILGEKTIALIMAKYPLVVVLDPCAKTLYETLEKEGVSVIEAEDWDSRQYSIDISKLKSVFPNGRWKSKVVNSEHLSIHDLWWATI